MNAACRSLVIQVLTAGLSKLTGGGASVAPALTHAHLGALSPFLQLLPISDLLAFAEGQGTIDNTLDIAEAGASIVARAFPPAAITAEEVKLGLEALQLLLDAAGLGPSPFKIEPGYRPVTDAYAGARGHI